MAISDRRDDLLLRLRQVTRTGQRMPCPETSTARTHLPESDFRTRDPQGRSRPSRTRGRQRPSTAARTGPVAVSLTSAARSLHRQHPSQRSSTRSCPNHRHGYGRGHCITSTSSPPRATATASPKPSPDQRQMSAYRDVSRGQEETRTRSRASQYERPRLR